MIDVNENIMITLVFLFELRIRAILLTIITVQGRGAESTRVQEHHSGKIFRVIPFSENKGYRLDK